MSKVLKIAKSASRLLFVSWYIKLLGVGCFLILARYLDKSDFGIIAGCFVVQSFFAILANFGTGHYLVRKVKITEEDLHVAWTINVTTRSLIALLVFALSEPIAKFMNIAELSVALKFMALSPFFIGLHNPALNIKTKNLDYKAISYLGMTAKTISALITIFIVIVYQSYFAVVIAEVVYQFIYAVGSFMVIEYKPKFMYQKIYKQWDFSKWILVKSFVTYVKNMCDSIIISRNFSLAELGVYNFAKESSTTAVSFIMAPIFSVFYTGLSDYAENRKELANKIYNFVIVISFIYMPIVFGGVYLSELIIPVVFGEKWLSASDFFSLFLIMTYAGCFNQVLSEVFILINEVKKHFWYECFSSMIVLSLLSAVALMPLDIFALFRVLVAYLVLFSMVLFLSSMVQISLFIMLKLMLLPALLSVAMLFFIDFSASKLIGFSEPISLIMQIFAGAIFYFVFGLIAIKVLQNSFAPYSYLYNEVILKIYALMQQKIKVKRVKNLGIVD